MTNLTLLSDHPLVSVIVPSYNQGRFIRETIESILSQSYRPLEVLVIDGASTDETADVIKSFRDAEELRWYSEPDSGVVDAVNKGLARARGEIGAIQSSDDVYLPGAVAAAVQALKEDVLCGFVYGDIVKIDGDGNELSRTDFGPFSLASLLSVGTYVPQCSAFFRMDLARHLGGWREEVPYAADTDLWMRMAFHAKVAKLDILMAKGRMHDIQRDKCGANVIRDYCRMIESLTEIQRAPFRLRRAAAAGKLLQKNRYGYNDGYLLKFLRQWGAVLLFPPILGRPGIGGLIPGFFALHRCCSRIKQFLVKRDKD